MRLSLIGRLRQGKQLSRGEYFLFLGALWIYSAAWLIVWLYLLWNWQELAWLYRLALAGVLVLFTPTLSDLVCSYEGYQKWWKEQHPTVVAEGSSTLQ